MLHRVKDHMKRHHMQCFILRNIMLNPLVKNLYSLARLGSSRYFYISILGTFKGTELAGWNDDFSVLIGDCDDESFRLERCFRYYFRRCRELGQRNRLRRTERIQSDVLRSVVDVFRVLAFANDLRRIKYQRVISRFRRSVKMRYVVQRLVYKIPSRDE